MLFALQCLKPLQRNPGDTKQSDSFPVKMCKHAQIRGLYGEYQSQVTLSPAQHPMAVGGPECERVLVLHSCCETSHSLGLEHVLAAFPYPEPKSSFWLSGAGSFQPFVCFRVPFCLAFLETTHTLHARCR